MLVVLAIILIITGVTVGGLVSSRNQLRLETAKDEIVAFLQEAQTQDSFGYTKNKSYTVYALFRNKTGKSPIGINISNNNQSLIRVYHDVGPLNPNSFGVGDLTLISYTLPAGVTVSAKQQGSMIFGVFHSDNERFNLSIAPLGGYTGIDIFFQNPYVIPVIKFNSNGTIIDKSNARIDLYDSKTGKSKSIFISQTGFIF